MPIYEYLCEGCGKVNEKLQKVGDKPPARCDECGSKKLAKLVSRSAFQLKGGGWYSDLYASAKKKDGAKEGGKDGAKEGAKPAGEGSPAPASDAGAPPAKDAPASPGKTKPGPAPSGSGPGKADKKAG